MLEPPIKQLLLVEDDEQGVIPAELFFDEEVWEDSGAPPQLLVARNADEFKQLLGQHQHTIEAIVTDIILSNDPTAPGVNGVAVYAQLAAEAPDIPCFAITGQAPDSAAIEALRAGVVDYLKK
ncbi:MAG: response regulator, partial [Candidatus Eremiobacteraeota bacterium]|nr:response regulator [Candidatus Eremiobacteraeota bacterium]